MAQRDWAEKDYYAILGVSQDASRDEIKKAYRKLAQRYHPDANKGDAAAETRFKEISEAYAVLSNEDKKREYDQIRALIASGGRRWTGFGPGGGGNVRINIGDLFSDEDAGGLFDDLLGGFGFRPPRGRDVETSVRLSFMEAASGVTIEVPDAGKVRIPAGMKDGARIRVPGRGRPGTQGAPAGDLYVRVVVEPHEMFSWAPSGELLVTVPITFTEAALGAKVDVPTLDGSVTVKVPPGTQHGKTLRVRGRGASNATGPARDLLVRLEVQVPRKLSRREREILEQFAEVHKESPRENLRRAG